MIRAVTLLPRSILWVEVLGAPHHRLPEVLNSIISAALVVGEGVMHKEVVLPVGLRWCTMMHFTIPQVRPRPLLVGEHRLHPHRPIDTRVYSTPPGLYRQPTG